MKKSSCSIIGANGYIGRHLCALLNAKGFEVDAFGNTEQRNPAIPLNISYTKIDITDKSSIQKINFDVDYLFIFAGLTGTKIGFEKYEEFIQVNEIGLLNVLTELIATDIKPQVIFPSSRLVYKGSDFPLLESDPKEAKTIYAANKLNCEHLLEAYSNFFSIPYTVFRICVPYGNLFDDNFSYGTVGHFLTKASKGEPISLYGDGKLKRTFTHVESICNQIINAIQLKDSKCQIFNIDGETLTLEEAATIVAKKFNVNVEYTAWPKDDLKLESGHTVFNAQKINALIEQNDASSFENWVGTL